MQCTVCGRQLDPGILYCPSCRAATPALGANFAEMERRLAQLKTRRKAGMLGEGEYQAEAQQLVVRDQQGNSWWLRGRHGDWSWFNGQSWEPRDPAGLRQAPLRQAQGPRLRQAQEPRLRQAQPTGEVAQRAGAAAAPATAAPTKKSRWPYLLIGCFGLGFLVAMVVLVAGFLLLRDDGFTAEESVDAPVASTGSADGSTGPPSTGSGTGPEDLAAIQEAMEEEIEDHRPETLALMGRPDAFSISEVDVEGYKVTRESWFYYGLATQVDFFNGEAGFTTALEPLPEDTIFPAWYDPLSFSAGMSAVEAIDAARAASPAGQVPESPGVEGLSQEFPGGELLVGDQILIGLYDGRVVFVETVALLPEQASQ